MEWWAWVIYFAVVMAFSVWLDRRKRKREEMILEEPEQEETIRQEPNLMGEGPRAWIDGKEVEVERMQPESDTYSNRGFEFPEGPDPDPDFSTRNF
jgi:hypothetical protein